MPNDKYEVGARHGTAGPLWRDRERVHLIVNSVWALGEEFLNRNFAIGSYAVERDFGFQILIEIAINAEQRDARRRAHGHCVQIRNVRNLGYAGDATSDAVCGGVSFQSWRRSGICSREHLKRVVRRRAEDLRPLLPDSRELDDAGHV